MKAKSKERTIFWPYDGNISNCVFKDLTDNDYIEWSTKRESRYVFKNMVSRIIEAETGHKYVIFPVDSKNPLYNKAYFMCIDIRNIKIHRIGR